MGVEWKSYALKVSFLEIVQTLELCGLLCLALREAQKPIWCDLKVVYGCNAFGCFVERYFKLNFLDAELKKLEFRWELYPVTLPQSSIFKVRNYLVWTSFHHSLNLTEISLQTRLYLIVCIDVNLNISSKETKGDPSAQLCGSAWLASEWLGRCLDLSAIL